MTLFPVALEALTQPMLRVWRRAAASLESANYPLQLLSAAERAELTVHVLDGTAGIALVDAASVRFPVTPDDIAEAGIATLSMAGVGASVLGSVALARAITRELGAPVAAIVAGKGFGNLLAEGVGGYAFRWADLVDAGFDQIDKPGPGPSLPVRAAATVRRAGLGEVPIPYMRREEAILYDLLVRLAETPGLLFIGHGRGALAIDRVIAAIGDTAPAAALRRNLAVITLGAVADIPLSYPRVRQFIGRFDFLGLGNSAPTAQRSWVDMAAHSVNPAAPWPLPLSRLLSEASAHPSRTADLDSGMPAL